MLSQIEIRKTEDGSYTLFNPGIGETYHSGFGAVNESMHVFILAGLHFIRERERHLRILEVGLGTGLNCLLTLKEAEKSRLKIEYTAIEPFPPDDELINQLNYQSIICESLPDQVIRAGAATDIFSRIHSDDWDKLNKVTDHFSLKKIRTTFQDFSITSPTFNLVYFDAFSPAAQPELWTEEIFRKMAGMMLKGGVLVTYSAKGQVRRNMQAAGFKVERLPGPTGKREMLRGVI
jgi:tRNA U34 5-methylaminomethyl-2-thiouridine-forming methyltransferase MnmC